MEVPPLIADPLPSVTRERLEGTFLTSFLVIRYGGHTGCSKRSFYRATWMVYQLA